MTSSSRGVDSAAFDANFDPKTPRPPPVEHVGSSTLPRPSSPISPQPLSTRRPTLDRLRSASISQPARTPVASNHRHTASSAQADQTAQDLSATNKRPDDSPPEEPNFLTLLAAQERRVLELKEELQKAEDELKQLKKQWASHESTKRRNEGRRLHQLRPMGSTSQSITSWKDDPDGSSAWMYQEMERRKALITRGRRTSRRIFTGSRTPRPLSLVAQSATQLPDLNEDRFSLDGRTPRSRTTPDLMPDESGRGSPTSFYRSASSSPQRQSLYLSSGKQLASEWREGLWTFFEDLKHATVGDEPRSAPNAAEVQRKRNSGLESSKSIPPSGGQATAEAIDSVEDRRTMDDDEDDGVFGGVNVVNGVNGTHHVNGKGPGPRAFPKPPASKTSAKSHQSPIPLHTRVIDGETWDTWDSPDGKLPSSAHSSNNSFSAGNVSPTPLPSTPASSTSNSTDATPRQSIGPNGPNGPEKKRESIPWPVLTKLAPGQLRRTASHLMDEWEKSLVDEPKQQSKSSSKPAKRNDTLSPSAQITL